jgi:hypothetical protein
MKKVRQMVLKKGQRLAMSGFKLIAMNFDRSQAEGALLTDH